MFQNWLLFCWTLLKKRNKKEKKTTLFAEFNPYILSSTCRSHFVLLCTNAFPWNNRCHFTGLAPEPLMTMSQQRNVMMKNLNYLSIILWKCIANVAKLCVKLLSIKGDYLNTFLFKTLRVYKVLRLNSHNLLSSLKGSLYPFGGLEGRYL